MDSLYLEVSNLELRKIFIQAGCKESQFYSLPFGQAVAAMY